ncbi:MULTISPECIES: hypothetical protein [Oerskovia]|uniref:Uncharacterized protein n=1 Tax=Oerskovia gallyi TaxID=2762226 RepID=A0ABR8V0K5_9CELL|nr:hypothetical protein [Oerskovia gallyi]MBD7998320.1 hypothetical protein [Oerskovia gallyi]
MSDDQSPAHDVLPFGRAPRPDNGPALAERLRDVMTKNLGDHATGLDRVRIDAATVPGSPDVQSLDVDVTGLVVRAMGAADAPDPAENVEHVTAREQAVARAIRAQGHPVTLAGVAVDLDAEIRDLRFSWVEGADGSLSIEEAPQSTEHPVSGHLRAAASRDALVSTARELATKALADQGFTLTSLDVDLASRGPRAASIVASAKIRKGFLSASAQITATASIDQAMVLTLTDVGASSRNPVVAALLLAVRGKLEEVDGKRIDLASSLPPGVTLSDVRLDVGEQLVLSVRVG